MEPRQRHSPNAAARARRTLAALENDALIQGTSKQSRPGLAPPHYEVPFLREVYPVNERSLELLAEAARTDHPTARLVAHLRDPLNQMTPEARLRAARRPFLLIDMRFADLEWWTRARDNRLRSDATSRAPAYFPRARAIQLARATLMLAWHSVRADSTAANLTLGMTEAVSEVLGNISLTEIDRIIERQFRNLKPRWEDHPAVWVQLLSAAQTEDLRRARDLNIRGLRLIIGVLSTVTRSSR